MGYKICVLKKGNKYVGISNPKFAQVCTYFRNFKEKYKLPQKTLTKEYGEAKLRYLYVEWEGEELLKNFKEFMKPIANNTILVYDNLYKLMGVFGFNDY